MTRCFFKDYHSMIKYLTENGYRLNEAVCGRLDEIIETGQGMTIFKTSGVNPEILYAGKMSDGDYILTLYK